MLRQLLARTLLQHVGKALAARRQHHLVAQQLAAIGSNDGNVREQRLVEVSCQAILQPAGFVDKLRRLLR